MIKKLKEKWVEVALAVVTIISSYFVAGYATNKEINREVMEGEVLLSDLGFRYFYNFYRAFDPNTGSLRTDNGTKNIYVEELRSILDSLDTLSANPLYVEMSQQSSNLPIVASEIRAEISESSGSSDFSIRTSTTLRICALYIEESSEVVDLPDNDGIQLDIRTFAKRVCAILEG